MPRDVSWNESFDAEHGGFGGAPKFPHPTNLECLLRHWAATPPRASPIDGALDMATLTLERMTGAASTISSAAVSAAIRSMSNG